jgi:hypothetical protein
MSDLRPNQDDFPDAAVERLLEAYLQALRDSGRADLRLARGLVRRYRNFIVLVTAQGIANAAAIALRAGRTVLARDDLRRGMLDVAVFDHSDQI